MLRFLAFIFVVSCAPAPRIVFPATSGLEIGTVALGLSNVHVLFGKRVVLVDTGSPGEARQLEDRLYVARVFSD